MKNKPNKPQSSDLAKKLGLTPHGNSPFGGPQNSTRPSQVSSRPVSGRRSQRGR